LDIITKELHQKLPAKKIVSQWERQPNQEQPIPILGTGLWKTGVLKDVH
jgi:hypothetical protein